MVTKRVEPLFITEILNLILVCKFKKGFELLFHFIAFLLIILVVGGVFLCFF